MVARQGAGRVVDIQAIAIPQLIDEQHQIRAAGGLRRPKQDPFGAGGDRLISQHPTGRLDPRVEPVAATVAEEGFPQRRPEIRAKT